jgi:DNA-directed RNA polymerase specialized sigma24 family protein
VNEASSRRPDPAAARFCTFVETSRDRLRRALVAHHGPDVGVEALADGYAYAWAHWARVETLDNPVGYVFRVADRFGARRTQRSQREPVFDPDDVSPLPWFDEERHVDVVKILSQLPARQRAAVLLIHGYGWSYQQAATTLDLPITTVTNDATRGLRQLKAHATTTSLFLTKGES